MNRDRLAATGDGRFFANTTDQVFIPKEMPAGTLLDELDKFEDEYRAAIAKTLLSTPRECYSNPLVHSAKKPDLDLWERQQGNHPAFFMGTLDESSGSYKFTFLRRSLILRDWLQQNGHWPQKTSSTGDIHFSKRLKIGLKLHDMVFNLTESEYTDMINSVILTPSSRSDLDRSWEPSIQADFEHVREWLSKNTQIGIQKCLQILLEDHLPAKEKGLFGADRRAALMFLMWLTKKGHVLLPIPLLRRSPREVANLFSTCFRPSMLQLLLPQHRYEELVACELYDRKPKEQRRSKKIERRIQECDLLTLYFGTNYCTAKGFNPAAIDLARIASAPSKNGLRMFFFGCLDFYNIKNKERRKWEGIFSVRSSAALVDEDQFALFRLPASTAREALKVQVATFERRSGLPFPEQGFASNILSWTDLLEQTIKTISSRKDTKDFFVSSIAWLTFLSTLPEDERPEGFHDIDRQLHIRNVSDLGTRTFANFLTSNDLKQRNFFRPLHQIFLRWAGENGIDTHSPIKPGVDWKNDAKEYRTRRKSIPSLIIETLIAENAAPASDGTPYGLFQKFKDESKATTVNRIDGRPIDSVVPIQPAVIDCILNLGMRSSSARWLDSGQGDEFLIDVEEFRRQKNPAKEAVKGVQQGAIQLLQIGPEHEVLSMKVLKEKTFSAREIPYLPEALALRLQAIKRLQEKHNPIRTPIRAIEKRTATNDKEQFPLVFPLFRDPTYASVTAVSGAKLHSWWRYLLQHCEPIVHRKRRELFGPDVSYYHFFDKQGNAIWDIHSIRVAVVTALLEMGVPPTIVQHLVGHRSPIMTLHYHAVNNKKTHDAILKAFEERRQRASKAIADAVSEDELEESISQIMGGLVTNQESEALHLAAKTLRKNQSLANSEGSFSVFSHGICPGGTCGDGGETKGSVRTGVHRDKACSRCRFRITGPAFLNGLILNANILMSEIGASTKKEIVLNGEIREARRANLSLAVLETRLNQEREFRDELWSDWAAEYQAVRKCLEMLDNATDTKNLPAVPSDLETKLRDEHHFNLLHQIMTDSASIAAASADVPSGLQETRNQILWDIAANNGEVAEYLLKLPKSQRDTAMNEFGDLVSRLERESDNEEGIIPGLIDGTLDLPSSSWNRKQQLSVGKVK
jgi:intergrase/recombinase